jgi:hypothetical protein
MSRQLWARARYNGLKYYGHSKGATFLSTDNYTARFLELIASTIRGHIQTNKQTNKETRWNSKVKQNNGVSR